MNDGNLIVAYHGCDITTRDDLVSGRTAPESSRNRYDWLGPGFYLFEGDHERALDFANSSHNNPNKRFTAQPIANPAVVGCVLSVQRCLDMTTRLGLREFDAALSLMLEGIKASGAPVPKNTAANSADTDILLRRLDNAVFNFIHSRRDGESGRIDYQLVRGAFRQGEPLAENSGFHRGSHIQIALRDPTCIRGCFLLPGEKMMDQADDALARQALVRAKSAVAKPRHRAA